MEALEALSAPAVELPESLRLLLRSDAALRGLLRVRALRELVRLLAPPSGPRRVTRSLHPDALAGGFALILAAVLFRVWREQPATAASAVAIAAVALLAYAAARRRVLRRYAAFREQEREAARGVERAVERWMTLRCCVRERTVHDAAGDIPLEELPQRLAAVPPP